MTKRLLWNEDGGDWPNRDHSRFVSAAGFQWHVQLMGAGPVVLLAHGLGASTHSWRRLAPMLARRFTVIGMDLPGHGFTDLPAARRMSMSGMAEALGDLLRELDADPAHAVGHSAGASLLVRMCLDERIAPKTLVSLNGALLPFGGVGQMFSPLAKLLFGAPFIPKLFARMGEDRRAIVNMLRSTGSAADDEGVELYARLFGNAGHVEGVLAMMANWDLRALQRDLPQLKTPLVMVTGGKDHTVPAEEAFRIRELARGSRVVCLRHLGHLAHEEAPRDVADLIIKLLDDPSAL
ncbi:alpha/beta fold hydrolase BchO [Methylocapsa palsarum]|nr:alpha/beta fold hydrolase BchO [Methylocapsa palsarum]